MAQKIRIVSDLVMVLVSTRADSYQRRLHAGAVAHSESLGYDKLVRRLLHSASL